MVAAEIVESLRAAQELISFIRNNTDPSGSGGHIEIEADEGYSQALCALLNDAEERVGSALHGIEIDT
jgi:hypothetical protein